MGICFKKKRNQRVCYIGRNNTNKSKTLITKNQYLNKEIVKSIYLDSEENLDLSINGITFKKSFIMSNLDLIVLKTYATKDVTNILDPKQKINKAQEIFKFVIEYYAKDYKEKLNKFDRLYKNIPKLSSFMFWDDRFANKKPCSSGINTLLVLIAYIVFIEKNGIKTALIDEIERHLDSKNTYNITKFLVNELFYLEDIFISTHSEDVIAALDNFVISDIETKKEYNSNDYTDPVVIKNKFFYAQNIEDGVNLLKEKSEFILKCIIKIEDGEEISEDEIEEIKQIKNKNEDLTSIDIENINLILDEVLENG